MLCNEIQSVKADNSKADIDAFYYLCNNAIESFSHYKLNELVAFINKLYECQQLNGLFDTVRLELKKTDSTKSSSVSEHYQKLVDQTFSILHQDSVKIAFGESSTIEEFASDVYYFVKALLVFLTQLTEYGLGSTEDLLKNMQMKCNSLLNTTSDLSVINDVCDLYYDLEELNHNLRDRLESATRTGSNSGLLSKQVPVILSLLNAYICTAKKFMKQSLELNLVSEKSYDKNSSAWLDIVFVYTRLLSRMFSITRDLQFLELISSNTKADYCRQAHRIQDYCYKFKELTNNKRKIVARLEIIVESIMIGLVNNFILLVNLRLKEKRLTESSELTRVNHYLKNLNNLRELTADTLADEAIN